MISTLNHSFLYFNALNIIYILSMLYFTCILSNLNILLMIVVLVLNYLFLVGLCFAKFKLNAIYLQCIIKLYLLYSITIFNCFASFIFINYLSCIEIYIITLISIRLNTLSNWIILTVLIVSSCVIINSIDYLSIVDSYLFLIYILIFQFTMINFILCHDLILSFLFWDLLVLLLVGSICLIVNIAYDTLATLSSFAPLPLLL